jgi:GPI mannosyltransferase 3
MNAKFWLCIVVYRIANALLVQTYFNPDEYWQSVEVAHNAVFGYGELTWEWQHRLRGYTHPLPFVALFYLLKSLRIDSALLVQHSPRILSALFAALTDYAIYALARRLFGRRVARYVLASHLLCWFVFYSLVRTFSNSLETTLTIVGLSVWPWCAADVVWPPRGVRVRQYRPHKCTDPEQEQEQDQDERHVEKRRQMEHDRYGYIWPLAWAGAAVAVRPTAAIVWLAVGLQEIYALLRRGHYGRLAALARSVTLVGALTLAGSVLIDRVGFGQWTVVVFNFVQFNVLSGSADFYGVHAWHWYVSNGWPTMLFTCTPLLFVGVYVAHREQRAPFYIMAATTAVYSLLGHKEFRFVMPLLPVALMYVGLALATICRPVATSSVSRLLLADRSKQTLAAMEAQASSDKPARRRRWAVALALLLVGANVPMAIYFSQSHQRGVIDAMAWLRDADQVESIHFLMPCHSTPLYSHLHKPVATRYLRCLPPLPDVVPHYDEADDFFSDPASFVERFYGNKLPSHIVIFEPVFHALRPFLAEHRYRPVAQFHHSYTPTDARQGDVLIFERPSTIKFS